MADASRASATAPASSASSSAPSTAAPSRINFYGHTKPWGEFSNFFPAPFTMDGSEWPTTEHYFQAMKFHHDAGYVEKIRTASTPAKAKQLGRTRAVTLRSDWEDVKTDIMREAVMAKFQQNNKLKRLLLSTGSAYLAEHTPRDRIWGDGGDGTGENRLGKVLMETRHILRREESSQTSHLLPPPAAADSTPKSSASHHASDSSQVNGVVYVNGDLLTCSEPCLAQQCNCVSKTAKGLSKLVFTEYPAADVYSKRRRTNSPPPKMGTVSLHKCMTSTGTAKTIINMFAQYRPGKPSPKPDDSDNAQGRLQAFRACLDALARKQDLGDVAFPYMIGCGLAGGKWASYRRELEAFASSISPRRVVVYSLSKDIPELQ